MKQHTYSSRDHTDIGKATKQCQLQTTNTLKAGGIKKGWVVDMETEGIKKGWVVEKLQTRDTRNT